MLLAFYTISWFYFIQLPQQAHCRKYSQFCSCFVAAPLPIICNLNTAHHYVRFMSFSSQHFRDENGSFHLVYFYFSDREYFLSNPSIINIFCSVPQKVLQTYTVWRFCPCDSRDWCYTIYTFFVQ